VQGKVRLHRYICLWWASERKLGKKPVTKPKNARKNQGNRARHLATKEATPTISGWFKMVLKRVNYDTAYIILICCVTSFGQNRIYTPYMAVCMVISLPKIPYIHRMYLLMYGSGQPYA
jgi:predicted naringenin-chalcone synthase